MTHAAGFGTLDYSQWPLIRVGNSEIWDLIEIGGHKMVRKVQMGRREGSCIGRTTDLQHNRTAIDRRISIRVQSSI